MPVRNPRYPKDSGQTRQLKSKQRSAYATQENDSRRASDATLPNSTERRFHASPVSRFFVYRALLSLCIRSNYHSLSSVVFATAAADRIEDGARKLCCSASVDLTGKKNSESYLGNGWLSKPCCFFTLLRVVRGHIPHYKLNPQRRGTFCSCTRGP